jgi:peptidoglycan/xylan/chitin deacetylase (PgdA/CDA1 family)
MHSTEVSSPGNEAGNGARHRMGCALMCSAPHGVCSDVLGTAWGVALLCAAALGATTLLSCGGDGGVSTEIPLQPAEFSVSEHINAALTDWHAGKAVAMTFSFDDVRESSYRYAAPWLEEYGLRGTFNLNTKAVGNNWGPWIALQERGHELANHGWSHRVLSELPLDEARFEIERAREDLLANIPGLGDVASFTYPQGQSSPDVREIVMETHLGARGYWGWNSPTPQDYSMLRGRSFRGVQEYIADVGHLFNRGGWLIQNFHGVVENGPSEETFRAVLAYAADRDSAIWIDTQAAITRYTLARESHELVLSGGNPGTITLVDHEDDPRVQVPLTVRIEIDSDAVSRIVIRDTVHILEDRSSLLIQMVAGESVTLTGYGD